MPRIPPEIIERRRVMRKRNAIYERYADRIAKINAYAGKRKLKARQDAEKALKEMGETFHG